MGDVAVMRLRRSILASIRGVAAAALLGLAFPAIAFAQAAEQSAPKSAPLKAAPARLTFIGHATFLIESPQLVRIATDYNDYVRPPVLPDIITMNHAHDTHFTDHPDPAITYVLAG